MCVIEHSHLTCTCQVRNRAFTYVSVHLTINLITTMSRIQVSVYGAGLRLRLSHGVRGGRKGGSLVRSSQCADGSGPGLASRTGGPAGSTVSIATPNGVMPGLCSERFGPARHRSPRGSKRYGYRDTEPCGRRKGRAGTITWGQRREAARVELSRRRSMHGDESIAARFKMIWGFCILFKTPAPLKC